MTAPALFIVIWLIAGLLVGKGLWLSSGAVLLWVVVAHSRNWSVTRSTLVGVALAATVTVINISFGG